MLSLQLTVGPLQMVVPNGATMTAPVGIFKGISNSTITVFKCFEFL